MRLCLFALKVQYNLAQGGALGYDITRPMRPERATHYNPMFCIALTLHTAAIRRGSITACHGAPLLLLMCFVGATAYLAQKMCNAHYVVEM